MVQRLLMAILLLATPLLAGCRAIRQGTESRQSIAAKRLSRQGLEAMHRGRWEHAEELFSGALDLNAADDRANWGLAETMWHRGQRSEAIVPMERAVRLSGSHPELLVRLGRMYLELGRAEDAAATASEALQAGRELPEAWALHADCLNQQGATEQALSAYHQALAMRPDYPEVQVNVAELYRRQGRYDRLLATLDRLREATAGEGCPTRVHVLRGVAMGHLGRPGEAAACFAEAARLAPGDPGIHLQIAALAMDQGDYAAARHSLDKALRLQPQSELGGELAQQIQIRQAMAVADSEGSAARR